ncbi:MAG: histidine--tRNA ligase [Anaerolineae bacterium]
MRYQRPTGTNDILPDEQPYWRYVFDHIHHVAALYGYQQIETPIFEDTAVFARGVGEDTDIVQKEMYTFDDRGGNPLTLRPEFTAGVVRAYIENGMHVWPQPVKLYSIGPTFRHDRPQAHRYRQFWQLNVEAIGEQDPAVDLEIMSLAWQLYHELGITEISFQVNSTGCRECRPAYLAKLADFFTQRQHRLGEDDQRRLRTNPLRILDTKDERLQDLVEAAPKIGDYLCDECRDHFNTLLSYLDLQGRPYTINPRLVRGLDYYTKTVFEVWSAALGGAQSAISGGGRYDGLAEVLGGDPTPGVGYAAGIERMISVMQELGMEPPALPTPQIALIYLGDHAKRTCIELISELREQDIGTVMFFDDPSMRSQMRSADRANVKYALILGERELEQGVVAVKDMLNDGSQQFVDRDAIMQWLSQHLNRSAPS